MLFCWAYFQGSLFSEGLIIGGNFAFQNGLDLTIKTASINSPIGLIHVFGRAYYRKDTMYLRLRFGGLLFGRAYLGGGGGLIIEILWEYLFSVTENRKNSGHFY